MQKSRSKSAIAAQLPDNEVFIDLNTFATRLSISLHKARELVLSNALCDRGIAVNINAPGTQAKNATIRINWPLYLEYVRQSPALDKCKRVKARVL